MNYSKKLLVLLSFALLSAGMIHAMDSSIWQDYKWPLVAAGLTAVGMGTYWKIKAIEKQTYSDKGHKVVAIAVGSAGAITTVVGFVGNVPVCKAASSALFVREFTIASTQYLLPRTISEDKRIDIGVLAGFSAGIGAGFWVYHSSK